MRTCPSLGLTGTGNPGRGGVLGGTGEKQSAIAPGRPRSYFSDMPCRLGKAPESQDFAASCGGWRLRDTGSGARVPGVASP